MTPSAVDPDPVVQAKQMPLASKGGDAPSTENMGTRRKLVIFSGMSILKEPHETKGYRH